MRDTWDDDESTADDNVEPDGSVEWFDPGRSSLLSSALGLVILSCPTIGTTGAALGVWDGPRGPVPWGGVGQLLTLGIAALFWTTFGFTVRQALRQWRQGQFGVGERGLWIAPNDKIAWLLPWSEVLGVGVAYEMARPMTLFAWAPKRRDLWALEIFVHDDVEMADRTPERAGLPTLTASPPKPDLPHRRYLIMLPRLVGLPSRVENAMLDIAPGLWIGQYERAGSLNDAEGL